VQLSDLERGGTEGRHPRAGARTTTGSAGKSDKAPRVPASGRGADSADSRGVSAYMPASGGPRPREARPQATHCAWAHELAVQRDSARTARAMSRRGAARRRLDEIVLLCPCLNTYNSKKLNRSAQSSE
jgi:hypothetical protein